MAENKVRFGISNVYIAFIKDDDSYDVPIRIPGARTLTLDQDGDTRKWYADNIPYVAFSTNNGYTGSIEMTYFPDAVLQQMFGWMVDDNGALIEDAEAVSKAFAIMYEVKGDAKNRRAVLYNVTATRPSENAQTQEESIDPQTQTLNIVAIPKEMQVGPSGSAVAKQITKAAIEPSTAGQAAYDAFFDAVYLPVVS